MTKISDMVALTGAGADVAADLVPIVDMSETGAARNKKITLAELKIALGVPAAYTDEQVRDVIAAALVDGTNITITADDGADTITIDAAAGGGLDAEAVMDLVADMLTQGSNVTLTYDDGTDTLTIAAAGGGSVPFATSADINAGTEASEAISPDALAGSNFGIKTVVVLLSDPAGSAVTTGDGRAYFRVPSDLNGMNLIACGAVLDTAGTGGGYLLQLRRKRFGTDNDMLSTRISIDSGENDSADAGTPPVINASYDDVQTADRIYFDRDGVPTGGKGDSVWMQFQLP